MNSAKKSWYDNLVKDVTKTQSIGGRFGLEIEMELEGDRFDDHPMTNINRGPGQNIWFLDHDSSLRGLSCELVLNRPLNRGEAVPAVEHVYSYTAKNNIVIRDSMRAGVHVHMDMNGQTIREMVTFLCTYWLVEAPLINALSGEDRAGNTFCLRVTEADFSMECLLNCLTHHDLHYAGETDSLKYAAANWAALRRLGTLEFRSLRTPRNPKPIIAWIDVLEQLFAASKEFSDPIALIEAFSDVAPEEFVRRLLGPYMDQIGSVSQIFPQMLQAMRVIQPIAYEVNWRY